MSGLATCHAGCAALTAASWARCGPTGSIPACTSPGVILLPRARRHRRLLGRPAGHPRAGSRHLPAGLEPERHPHPLDRGQARRRRPRRHGHHRACSACRHLVGQPDRPGGRVPASFGQLQPVLAVAFGARGIVPVGYAAFAFVLGVAVGVLVRRTVPAMAVTLAVFAAVQVIMPNMVRPHLITPGQCTAPSRSACHRIDGPQRPADRAGDRLPGAWIVSNQTITPAGHVSSCRGPGLPVRHPASVRRLARQAAPAAADQLPARQPLLGLPGVRDRDLPRPRPGPGRILRLADPPRRLS